MYIVFRACLLYCIFLIRYCDIVLNFIVFFLLSFVRLCVCHILIKGYLTWLDLILIILALNIRKKRSVNDYILLPHYLVKYRSRSLAVYSNAFILDTLGSACMGLKNHCETTKSLQICYLFNSESSDQDLRRRRTKTTHHQRVGRSEPHSYWQCC